MTEISDVLRSNTGLLFNISANTGGELVIANAPPYDEWTDATLSAASWTDPTYNSASWTDYTY